MDLTKIISSIAESENTPELRSYWERRFNSLLNGGIFTLNQNTLDVLENNQVINKPITPYGTINISKLLNEDSTINEVELQNTIDASVRLLDNILDAISGEDHVIKVMHDFRKIALGISNYDVYIHANAENKLIQIDTLGNLFSNGAYRSSESIAEEKGACKAWDTIKTRLRNKTFEYWYHTETSKVVDAHTLNQEFSQESVIDSGYEIIPRRNSHILVYPNDPQWAIWNDRHVETNINNNKDSSTVKKEQDPKMLEEKTNDQIPLLPDEGTQSENQIIEKPITHEIITEEAIEPVLNLGKFEDNKDTDQSPAESNEKDNPANESMESSTHADQAITDTTLEDNKAKQSTPKLELAAGSEHVEEHAEDIPSFEIITESNHLDEHNPHYQIGELVTITDKNSPFFKITAQVVDISRIKDTDLYTLKSTHDEINEVIWRAEQLTSVDLFELLDRINITPKNSKQGSNVVIQAFVINEENKILVSTEGSKHHLPEFNLPHNAIPEQVLPRLFSEKYNTGFKIVQEIGSAVEFSQTNCDFKVILSFQGNIDFETELPNTEWMRFRDAQFSLSPSTRVICNKFNKSKLTTMNHHQASNMNQNTAPSQPNNTSQHAIANKAMSQYIFKLENIVQSQLFGNVTVNFKYEDGKPFLTDVSGQQLNPELNYFADVVMHFANHLLSLDQTPIEISQFLSKISDQDNTIQMNELLKLIAESIKNAPAQPGA